MKIQLYHINSKHESANIEVIEEREIHVQNIALGLAFIKSQVNT